MLGTGADSLVEYKACLSNPKIDCNIGILCKIDHYCLDGTQDADLIGNATHPAKYGCPGNRSSIAGATSVNDCKRLI